MNDTARIVLEFGCNCEEQGKFKQAFQAYLKAAKLGNKEAQVNLANLYDEGKGCVQDSNKAVYWYKRSFKLGCPEAASNLGTHYKSQEKKRWAKYWFEKAMLAGDGDAALELFKLCKEDYSDQATIKEYLIRKNNGFYDRLKLLLHRYH